MPALVVAACVLAYYSYLAAAQFEQLGEKSIAESSLQLVQDKVDRLERNIIAADNRVFDQIDLNQRQSLRDGWKPEAERISPSVRAAAVLDEHLEVVSFAARASKADERAFLKVFLAEIVPDLNLQQTRPGVLKHLHKSYDVKNYLISYKAVRHRGQRFYLTAHHDTGFLVRTVFPSLFRSQSGKEWHNVVDSDNRRVFGPSLAEAGDYVVGVRFPTTLYLWRLQVAPKIAPLLEEKGRKSRVNQAALIGLSLAIILIAVGFILYAADRERRVAGLKSEFIANVSHELKTPLSVIRMFGEMLLTHRVRDERKRQEYLEIICSESERLTGLIENVLDFAALEGGKRRYELRDCELADVIDRAIEASRYRFERDGAELSLHVRGGAPRAKVDEQALLLAILNLLDNALKYGGATPVELGIESQGDSIEVRVRDHGPGLPPGDHKRVFERFYRHDPERRARGSGIGLALVKHIAEAHGGRVWAHNAEDGGAVVGFSIPRGAPRAAAPSTETGPGRHRVDSAQAADIVARQS